MIFVQKSKVTNLVPQKKDWRPLTYYIIHTTLPASEQSSSFSVSKSLCISFSFAKSSDVCVSNGLVVGILDGKGAGSKGTGISSTSLKVETTAWWNSRRSSPKTEFRIFIRKMEIKKHFSRLKKVGMVEKLKTTLLFSGAQSYVLHQKSRRKRLWRGPTDQNVFNHFSLRFF